MEEFRRPLSGRAQVQQIMRAAVQAVKGVSVDVQAQFMGDGRQM